MDGLDPIRPPKKDQMKGQGADNRSCESQSQDED